MTASTTKLIASGVRRQIRRMRSDEHLHVVHRLRTIRQKVRVRQQEHQTAQTEAGKRFEVLPNPSGLTDQPAKCQQAPKPRSSRRPDVKVRKDGVAERKGSKAMRIRADEEMSVLAVVCDSGRLALLNSFQTSPTKAKNAGNAIAGIYRRNPGKYGYE